jgi:hypothetical protein
MQTVETEASSIPVCLSYQSARKGETLQVQKTQFRMFPIKTLHITAGVR